MNLIGKMRWNDGRLQLWNWWRRSWLDYTEFKWAVNLENQGFEKIRAQEYDLYRLGIYDQEGTISIPLHSPGWFCYQALRKIGFELIKSEPEEILEGEVIENVA